MEIFGADQLNVCTRYSTASVDALSTGEVIQAVERRSGVSLTACLSLLAMQAGSSNARGNVLSALFEVWKKNGVSG